MDLATLAHAIPAARAVLLELLNAKYRSIRTAAALALVYIEGVPQDIELGAFIYAMRGGLIWSLPMPTYRSVLTILRHHFEENHDLAECLLEQFEKHVPKGPDRRILRCLETAVFLADLGMTSPAAMNEFMRWHYTDEHMPKRLTSLASLLESNRQALEYVAKCITLDSGFENAYAETWLHALLMVDPRKASEDALDFVFKVAEQRRHYPYYLSCIRVMVNFANLNVHRAQALARIEQALNSTEVEVLRLTLRGLWELVKPEKSILQRVEELTQSLSEASYTPAAAGVVPETLGEEAARTLRMWGRCESDEHRSNVLQYDYQIPVELSSYYLSGMQRGLARHITVIEDKEYGPPSISRVLLGIGDTMPDLILRTSTSTICWPPAHMIDAQELKTNTPPTSALSAE